jgi:hypothetical protein
MELKGITASALHAFSSLSPGQKAMPVPEDSVLILQRRQAEQAKAPEEREGQNRFALPEKEPVSFEERLKQMISAEEIRRLMYLYSPFARKMLNTEERGTAINRQA